jgi:hypothetical protein
LVAASNIVCSAKPNLTKKIRKIIEKIRKIKKKRDIVYVKTKIGKLRKK